MKTFQIASRFSGLIQRYQKDKSLQKRMMHVSEKYVFKNVTPAS